MTIEANRLPHPDHRGGGSTITHCQRLPQPEPLNQALLKIVIKTSVILFGKDFSGRIKCSQRFLHLGVQLRGGLAREELGQLT